MYRTSHRNVLTMSFAVVIAAAIGVSVTSAQTAERPIQTVGEVTANDVYVRGGPSLNHYPLLKINAGDRVSIVSDSGDWFEIRPPVGVFSYISADYVDTTSGAEGVVNGDNVRVRAGSVLADFAKLKYVVQTKLKKGAKVTVLQRDADGFLRIKPPVGITVWVSRKFVEPIPSGLILPETSSPVATPVGASGSGAVASPTTASGDGVAGVPDDLSALPETEQRSALTAIDTDARAELDKPVVDRDFSALIQRYQTVADQRSGSFSSRYALARVEQLTDMASVVATVKRVRSLGDEADSKRKGYLDARSRIRTVRPPIPTELDAQGELRVSALYPPGSMPRRYRLIDRKGDVEKTIGYVELPPNSDIRIDDFLGRFVGVRAEAKRLQRGGVDPVPIFVVSELVLLHADGVGGTTQD